MAQINNFFAQILFKYKSNKMISVSLIWLFKPHGFIRSKKIKSMKLKEKRIIMELKLAKKRLVR